MILLGMQLAVIKTGGKQYVISRGQRISVEKLPYNEGDEFDFNEVLALVYAGQVKIGSPYVSGAKVRGKVLSHALHDKVIVFKFKAKKRQKRKRGHRQAYTLVEIMDIKDKDVKSADNVQVADKAPQAPAIPPKRVTAKRTVKKEIGK